MRAAFRLSDYLFYRISHRLSFSPEGLGRGLAEALRSILQNTTSEQEAEKVLTALSAFLSHLPEGTDPVKALKEVWQPVFNSILENTSGVVRENVFLIFETSLSHLPKEADSVKYLKEVWEPFFSGVVEAMKGVKERIGEEVMERTYEMMEEIVIPHHIHLSPSFSPRKFGKELVETIKSILLNVSGRPVSSVIIWSTFKTLFSSLPEGTDPAKYLQEALFPTFKAIMQNTSGYVTDMSINALRAFIQHLPEGTDPVKALKEVWQPIFGPILQNTSAERREQVLSTLTTLVENLSGADFSTLEEIFLFLLPIYDEEAIRKYVGDVRNKYLKDMVKATLGYSLPHSTTKAKAASILYKALKSRDINKEDISEGEVRKRLLSLILHHYHPSLEEKELEHLISWLGSKKNKRFFASREKLRFFLALLSQEEEYLKKINQLLPNIKEEDKATFLKLAAFTLPLLSSNPAELLPKRIDSNTSLKDFLYSLRIKDSFFRENLLPLIASMGNRIEENYKLILWYGNLKGKLPKYREALSIFTHYFEDPERYKEERYEGFNPPSILKERWMENIEESFSSSGGNMLEEMAQQYNHALSDLENHLRDALREMGRLGEEISQALEGKEVENLRDIKSSLNALRSLPQTLTLRSPEDVGRARAEVAKLSEKLKAAFNTFLHEHGKEYGKGEVERLRAYVKGNLSKDLNRLVNIFNEATPRSKLLFAFTDDAWDLFNMGKSSTISSCQAYDYPESYKIGLLGAIANPWVKMAEIKGNGEILARAKLYLLTDGKHYYVKVDLFYGDSRLIPSLKKRLQEILESWRKEGIIQGYAFPGSALNIVERPVGPSRAPIYTDVGCCGRAGVVWP